MSKKYAIDKHHLIPTSRWGANNESNILKIRVNLHRALHILFSNDTPDEQLRKIIDINNKVFKEDFKQELYNLLNCNNYEDIYKEEAIKKIIPKKFKS